MSGTAEGERRHTSHGYGWMLFASVLFVVAGLFNLVWGLTALINDDQFHADELLFGDLSLWGVVNIVFAVLQFVTAGLLLVRRPAGVVLGIVIAVVHATVTLFSVGAYPLWSVMLLVLDAMIIYGLTVHAGADD
jgi:hypothetical protein